MFGAAEPLTLPDAPGVTVPTDFASGERLCYLTNSADSAPVSFLVIRERLENGREAFARQYLLFSRLVDGEEAELYFFSDLPSYVEQHQDTFCAAYAKLRQEDHMLRRVQDRFEACPYRNAA